MVSKEEIARLCKNDKYGIDIIQWLIENLSAIISANVPGLENHAIRRSVEVTPICLKLSSYLFAFTILTFNC